MTTAIVLSGGGSRGDFQVGALSALYDQGIRPDIICGTSVGAMNALMLTQGDAGLDNLRRIWFGLRRNDHMWLFADWWKQLNPKLRKTILGAINGDEDPASSEPWSVTTGLMFGGTATVAFGPVAFLAGALVGAVGAGVYQNITAEAIKDAIRILSDQARSTFNLNPVRALMDRFFDPKLHAEWVASGKKLRLASVALGSGQLGYFDENGFLLNRNQERVGDWVISMTEAAIASSSIAPVFPPVAFAGDHWIDGGHRENLPVQAAIGAGADRIYVVGASPLDPISSLNRTEDGNQPAPDFSRSTILALAERAILGIHLDEMAASDVYPLLSATGVEIHVIAPKFPTHDIVTIDPALIRANYDYGYRQAVDELKAAPAEVREMSDLIALAEGKIGRIRRTTWNRLNEPWSAEIPSLQVAIATNKESRDAAGAASVGPLVQDPFPQGDNLVPGDRLFPGQSIVSTDNLFRLIYQFDGNLVFYRDDTSPPTPLWASGPRGPLGFVVMQRDGNLVMYDESLNPLWASNSSKQDAHLKVSVDGTVSIYSGAETLWSVGASAPLPPGPQPIRTLTVVNNSSMSVPVRIFKIDDPVLIAALPGGEFTLAAGESRVFTIPSDVQRTKMVINRRHWYEASSGDTVAFAVEERVLIRNLTSRDVEAKIVNSNDLIKVVALPGGVFMIGANSESAYDLPADIERADVFINGRFLGVVLRGSNLDWNITDTIFIVNESGSSITARLYNIGDGWRWVTLPGGDLAVAAGATTEFSVPGNIARVQVWLDGVRVDADPGDTLVFRSRSDIVQR
jgi:NTE family protein